MVGESVWQNNPVYMKSKAGPLVTFPGRLTAGKRGSSWLLVSPAALVGPVPEKRGRADVLSDFDTLCPQVSPLQLGYKLGRTRPF